MRVTAGGFSPSLFRSRCSSVIIPPEQVKDTLGGNDNGYTWAYNKSCGPTSASNTFSKKVYMPWLAFVLCMFDALFVFMHELVLPIKFA